MEHFPCVTDSAILCPHVGSRCNFFPREHALPPGTWTSGNVHGHAYLRVFRSTENVKDCASPTGASSEHLAGTFQTLTKHDGWGKATVKGCTTVIKQRRDSGWGAGLHHYSIHLLLACLSAPKNCILPLCAHGLQWASNENGNGLHI